MPTSHLTFTDEYFAIAHDPDSCQPRLHRTALGLGLAAGLLCELLVEGWVDLTADKVCPVRHAGVPAEPLRHRVYELIRSETERWTVAVWLRYLARDAPDLVGDRLVMARRYRRESVRKGLLRRTVRRYRPVDSARAAYNVIRLRNATRVARLTPDDMVVIALACATELAVLIDLADPPELRELFDSTSRRLPPPLREVIAHTQACVAHHVITR